MGKPATNLGLNLKLLIVDDEPTLLETVDLRMRKEGYTTFTADSAEEAMRLYKRVKPDLVILDIMLPHRSGHDFCRAVRKESEVPIIFLTARADDKDRLAGFEMGADDYVTKPFNLSELAARVRAVLRRSSVEGVVEPVESGNLKLDPRSHEATLNDAALTLSPKEYALLYFLMKNTGQVFSRETLLDRVWGRDAYVSERTVDVHVRWLRQRIEPDADHPVRILTIRGVGYRFVG